MFATFARASSLNSRAHRHGVRGGVERGAVDGGVARLRRGRAGRPGRRGADQHQPVVDRDRIGSAVGRERPRVGVVDGGATGLDQVQARVRVLVDRGDHLAGLRIGGQPVALADEVPLPQHVTPAIELDHGRVEVAGRARLPLRPDAVLERDIDVAAERGDVVRKRDRLPPLGRRVEDPLARREHAALQTRMAPLAVVAKPASAARQTIKSCVAARQDRGNLCVACKRLVSAALRNSQAALSRRALGGPPRRTRRRPRRSYPTSTSTGPRPRAHPRCRTGSRAGATRSRRARARQIQRSSRRAG